MANLARYLSGRFGKDKKFKDYKNGIIPCIVENLEEEENIFNINKNDLASVLYDNVFTHLSLKDEKDYFALQYTDVRNINHWLDPTKPVRRQCKIGPPFTLRLRVKFYSTDPSRLMEELPRYLFVCQLKKDLRMGRLKCDLDSAVELAAYLVQAELGDYNEMDHDLTLISSFRFLPDDAQTEEFEEAVFQKFQTFKGRHLVPATIDKLFLSKVKDLPDYGVDRHEVVGKDGNAYTLGITASGILVYEGENKIGLFVWENMRKLEFKAKNLRIIGTDKDESGNEVEHEFIFKIQTARACKHLWKCAMEHHCFFRMSKPQPPPTRLQKFFRLRSSFHSSIRYTERGILEQQSSKIGIGSSSMRGSGFRRTPSKRYDPRESFLNRSRSLNISSNASHFVRDITNANVLTVSPDVHTSGGGDRNIIEERRAASQNNNISARVSGATDGFNNAAAPSWRHPIFPSTKQTALYENGGNESADSTLRRHQTGTEKRIGGADAGSDVHRPVRQQRRRQAPSAAMQATTDSPFLRTSTPRNVSQYWSGVGAAPTSTPQQAYHHHSSAAHGTVI